jgi:DNA-binding CsgD family transcriptional regulator
MLRPSPDGCSSRTHQLHALSPRERQAFFHVVAGKTIKEIAKEMSVRRKTAENYRAKVLAKVNVRNAVEAVHFAVIHGLLVSDSQPPHR